MRIPPLHMRNRAGSLLLVLVLMLGAVPIGWAQEISPDHLRYRLSTGDTLTWRMIGYDSIMIYDAPMRRISRERVEIIGLRCDTVLPQGYVVTMTLADYVAMERLDTLPPVERSTHPWVGRRTTYLMSPTGARLELLRYDRSPSVAPGGPLVPAVLPYFGGGSDSAYVVGSDIFPKDQWLFDNAFPPVRSVGTVYRGFGGTSDTLGHSVIDVTLNETGQVHYFPAGDTTQPMTSSVINSSCRLLLAADLGLPIVGTFDMVANLKLTNPQTHQQVEGRHMMGTVWELLDHGVTLGDRAGRRDAGE